MSFAFPGPMDSGGGYNPGMTLRDYFAIYAVLSAASYHGGFIAWTLVLLSLATRERRECGLRSTQCRG